VRLTRQNFVDLRVKSSKLESGWTMEHRRAIGGSSRARGSVESRLHEQATLDMKGQSVCILLGGPLKSPT
jgi:hypothetical protein